ncbi:MAG: hypothetical protein INR69_18125, partial [Mucilaginibacter polytrichastri]|nr:hypothetical protein [Mucilaginibacter polytrichastri]
YEKLVHPDLHFSYPFFAKDKSDSAITFINEWRGLFLKQPYFGFDDWRDQFEAGNKQANINIAECHQIVKKLSLKPFESDYKILILWLPEYLDKEGNTLLKVIEEPSPNTLFLLVAENQEEILNTILSRTQLVKIPGLAQDDIRDWLVTEQRMDEHQATSVAYLAEGSLSKAILLSGNSENQFHELFTDWLRGCYSNKMNDVFPIVDRLAEMGRETQKSFLEYGMKLMHDVLLVKAGLRELVHLPSSAASFIDKFPAIVSISDIEAINAELETASYHLERNANQKILFLDVSLQLVKILKFKTLPQGTHYIIQ